MPADLRLGNITNLDVGQAVDALANAYGAVIRAGLPLRLLPSVMLWGPPGVGKSQGVRQLGARIAAECGKRVSITDVRLLLFNPIDLRGIPTANADKTLAVWLRPQIFEMDGGEDVVNILFLDEISAAPQSVQAAAYQITLDRRVGEHALPENCIVIAAGNRVTDKSVAVKMPKALANRLCHFEIREDFESWRAWAVRQGIHEKVVAFLSCRPDFLMQFSTENDDLAFATPRAWEMVSNILNYVSDDVGAVYPLISGCIGGGAAFEFRSWNDLYARLPDVEAIFAGKSVPVPREADLLYATVSALAAHARKHIDDQQGIAHSLAYAVKLPPDFATVLFRDYMALSPELKNSLITMPDFSAWLAKNGRYFNR